MSKNLLNKTKALISALYNKTLSGELTWQEGDYSNSIESAVGENYLQLNQYNNDYNQDTEYVLFIKDESGNIKDRIDDAALLGYQDINAASSIASQFGGVPEVKLERLYFEGRRRALGADETLSDILGQLGVKS